MQSYEKLKVTMKFTILQYSMFVFWVLQ